jgi:hypothetical protein
MITIRAMTVLGLALLPGSAVLAEILQPVTHPEELGFDARQSNQHDSLVRRAAGGPTI